jgi:hypothetical protein
MHIIKYMHVLKHVLRVYLIQILAWVTIADCFFIVVLPRFYIHSHSLYFHLGDSSFVFYLNLFTFAYAFFGFSLSEAFWDQIKSGKEYVMFKHVMCLDN